MTRPRTIRARSAGLLAAVAALSIVLPAAPAAATWDCTHYPQPCDVWDIGTGIDVSGEAKGTTCSGWFGPAGQEGTQYWYSGSITSGTYLHPDVETKKMSLTCAVRTADNAHSGALRGSVTASSVAPLNNIVSAVGLPIDYWTTNDPQAEPLEKLYLCTTVAWTDKFGIGHSQSYDPCARIVRVVPV
jgi:hypothetical protein